MVCDENCPPNRLGGASSWTDPMAMLLEAKKENSEMLDQKVATKIAMALEETHKREEEQLKIALKIQSEEDDAAIKAALQEEEDLRMAKEAQVRYRCSSSCLLAQASHSTSCHPWLL
jgi:hypothetical protein